MGKCQPNRVRVNVQNTDNSYRSTMVINPQPFKHEKDLNGHFPRSLHDQYVHGMEDHNEMSPNIHQDAWAVP